jgi:Uma2 family endonuclease
VAGVYHRLVKALILDVSPDELARRKRTGEDRWDEMWEGVLHISPAPAYEHQRILAELLVYLSPLLKKAARGILVPGINVFRETTDYRIPDLTFVAAGREALLAEDGARGGPDVAIEIRSPGDESCEKLPFYAVLGVREVIIVHRDTKKAEIYRLAGPQYVAVSADARGFLRSEALAVRFGNEPGSPPRLVVEDAADPENRAEI